MVDDGNFVAKQTSPTTISFEVDVPEGAEDALGDYVNERLKDHIEFESLEEAETFLRDCVKEFLAAYEKESN